MTKDTEALVAALKPFARAAKWWKAFNDFHRITSLHQHGDCLEVHHLRDAEVALSVWTNAELGFDPTAEVGEEVFPHDTIGSHYGNGGGLDPVAGGEALREALEWYRDQLCEGFCEAFTPRICKAAMEENPTGGDCSGCRAVIALAALKGPANNFETVDSVHEDYETIVKDHADNVVSAVHHWPPIDQPIDSTAEENNFIISKWGLNEPVPPPRSWSRWFTLEAINRKHMKKLQHIYTGVSI